MQLGSTLGNAYSLPSLYDMYWIGDSETQGNANLKSETSSGTSYWASIKHPLFGCKAAYYFNSIEDLIQWRQVYLFGVTWKPVNVGKAEISNWEFEAELNPLKCVSLNGSFTLSHAKDMSRTVDGLPSSTYNKWLIYTPQQRIQATLKLADETKGVQLKFNHNGIQYSTADNLIDPLPAVTTIDASSFYKLNYAAFELVLELKLNNLLDKRYEIYAYIPQPGFNWSVSTALSFKM
jgi:outer membrane receptor protein involved in Fe transport